MSVINSQIFNREVVYIVGPTATVGPFAIPFPFQDVDEITVLVDDVEVSAYTVQQPSEAGIEGNTITFDDPVSNVTVTILSTTGERRTTADTFVQLELSKELDRIFAILQEIAQKFGRTLRLGYGEEAGVFVPEDGKSPIWDAASKTFVNGPTSGDIQNAQANATAAAASAAAAAASLASFNDKFLGAFAEAPTTDAAGNPLTGGELYVNTVTNKLNYYSGGWVQVPTLTGNEILALLLPVDGPGSGLNADLLDGQHSSAFAAAAHTHIIANITGLQTILDALESDIAGKAAASHVHDFGDLSYAGSLGFRNKIINGEFLFWREGFGPHTAVGYGADRWRQSQGGGTTQSVSATSFAIGQTDVAGNPVRHMRSTVSTGSLAGSNANYEQRIEDVRTLQGQTATLTFWAKADAAKNIAVEFTQNFGSGGSPSAAVGSIGVTTIALTTSWQKFTVTVTLPSIAGKTLGTDGNDYFSAVFWFDAGSDFNARTNSLGTQSGTFDLAQVQLEAGAEATEFEERHIQTEQALCHRYYEEAWGAYTSYDPSGSAVQRFWVSFAVPKRTTPTNSVVKNAGTATNPVIVRSYPAGVQIGMSATARSEDIVVRVQADAEL